ncbi:hypothetical protein [Rhodoferax sp.]|uniref:hypothetical protein n=1 Tax=Rhodoferax sp. TaxID=50421 RepID=UPI002608F157|nr:hypothetical protein [Rhodoferax sp.]
MDTDNELVVLAKLRWALIELTLVLMEDMRSSLKVNKSGKSADLNANLSDGNHDRNYRGS